MSGSLRGRIHAQEDARALPLREMSRGFRRRTRTDKENRLRGLAKVPAKESGLTAEDLVRVHSTTNHGGRPWRRKSR